MATRTFVEAVCKDSEGWVTVQRRKDVTGLPELDVTATVILFEAELDEYDYQNRAVRVVTR